MLLAFFILLGVFCTIKFFVLIYCCITFVVVIGATVGIIRYAILTELLLSCEKKLEDF